jgi:hypothetical protein
MRRGTPEEEVKGGAVQAQPGLHILVEGRFGVLMATEGQTMTNNQAWRRRPTVGSRTSRRSRSRLALSPGATSSRRVAGRAGGAARRRKRFTDE